MGVVAFQSILNCYTLCRERQSRPSLLLETSAYLRSEALVFDSITQARCGVRRVANRGIWERLTSGCMGRKASLGSGAGTTISGVHSVPAAPRSPQQLKGRRARPQGSPTNHAHVEMHSFSLTNVLHPAHVERYQEKYSEALLKWASFAEGCESGSRGIFQVLSKENDFISFTQHGD